MKFLADMCISSKVVSWLRSVNHDVVHLREQGLQRLADNKVFQKACKEERILLTFDLDFGEIVTGTRGTRTSVILFRLHNASPEAVVYLLETVIKEASNVLEQGAIVIVEDTRYRVRILPVG